MRYGKDDPLGSFLEQPKHAATEELPDPFATRATPPAVADAPAGIALNFFLGPRQESDEIGRLGSYRVLQQIGAGGMGIVFAAEDTVLKRRVAVKVMRPHIAVLPDARRRFFREAQAVASLDHEHIVSIYQVGEAPGALAVPFIVMPLLAGESLSTCLQREGALPIPAVLRIGRETAQGLAAAHAAGLIHRDIKPENIWLQSAGGDISLAVGKVKILDFGLARPAGTASVLTQTGAILGSPNYMAPEQANGLKIDARCDLFSLGCVLYRMATGRLPFHGPTLTAVLRAVAEFDPPTAQAVRPDVPPSLSKLIVHLMAKNQELRPPSARTVVELIGTIEQGSR
jgi:serine/threonine protein kinase